MAENIKLFGAHQNVHTGPQEHNHIENTKNPSKLVQRNKMTLDIQLANQLLDKYLIDEAYYCLDKESRKKKPQPNSSFTNNPSHSNTSSKLSFHLTIKNNEVLAEYKWISKKKMNFY